MITENRKIYKEAGQPVRRHPEPGAAAIELVGSRHAQKKIPEKSSIALRRFRRSKTRARA
jgi:hypothetical protein